MIVDKPRLTLSQLAEMHFHHRPTRKTFRREGVVEVLLRNDDGSVDEVVKQKNAETRWLQILYVYPGRDERNHEVFIANDDGWPMHPWKSVLPSNYSTDSDQVAFRTLDSTNLVWTFQTTFSAPAADRTFRYVGLKYKDADSGLSGTARLNPNVIAATRLTSSLTQTTTQTLEITYRISWQRA